MHVYYETKLLIVVFNTHLIVNSIIDPIIP